MAKGDEHNPWTGGPYRDYQGLLMSVSVSWDAGTRNITSGSAHRDVGCVYHTIIFANPSDQLLRKPLPSMTDAQTDVNFTAQQIRNATGARTIDDIYALGQCTAEP